MPPAGYRATTETVIKKSRFITTLARTDSEAEARAVVAQLRAAHPEANHHCLAFVIDDQGARQARTSDDGEPAGTAGVPMLRALGDLANVTAVVTRYFGGVKLGAGGLARAYGGCVADAAARVPRVERVTRPVWSVLLPHDQAGRAHEDLLRAGAVVLSSAYGPAGLCLRLVLPDGGPDLVARLTRGAVRPIPDGADVVEQPIADQS
jgi:uncharacterized YigZ family protein